MNMDEGGHMFVDKFDRPLEYLKLQAFDED